MPALLALLASALWGTADYLGGRLTRRRNVLVVLGASQLAGLITMLVLATLMGSWGAPLGYLPGSVVASLAGAAGLALYYAALASGTMGVVSPIASLGVLVPLAVGIGAGDAPSGIQFLGIAVAVVGVVLASGPEVSGAAGLRPVVMALGAALLLGASMVGIAAGSEVDVVMTMTAMRAVTVTLVVVVVLIARLRPRVDGRDVPAMATVGIFDVGANVTFGLASTLGMLSVVSVLGSLYPVGTILLARWVDGERLRTIQKAGVLLTLVGAAVISAG